MRPTPTPEPRDSGLERRAERLTEELLALASRRLRVALPRPEIRFDLRGKSAGQIRARDSGYLIRYNPQLLRRHPTEFLAQTVPHETAHLVAFSLFGPGLPPHGQAWREIMGLLGAAPERCHRYDVAGLETRHLRRFVYRCQCRVHRLTSIRHNRIRSGQVYLCRRCGAPLKPLPESTKE